MGELDITQSGAGHTIALGFGGSMLLDQGTLTVHHELHKPAAYRLEEQRCAGLSCLLAMEGEGRSRRCAVAWQMRLWSDSKTSVRLCHGSGPNLRVDDLGGFLGTTDEELAASKLGAIARLIDEAIVATPRATPLPQLEVGSYFPNVDEEVDLVGQIVWVPSLGLAVLDHGSRPPTAPST